jgi:hypothetical protein
MRRLTVLLSLALLLIPAVAHAQPSEPTPDPGQRGAGPCGALDAYAANYLDAFNTTTQAHPEALEILTAAPSSASESTEFVSELPPEDLLVLSDYYLALAESMDALTPPEFAREWHEIQRASFQLSGDIYRDGAELGLAAASVQHTQEASELISALEQFFEQPNRCPSFQTWARSQSVLASFLT